MGSCNSIATITPGRWAEAEVALWAEDAKALRVVAESSLEAAAEAEHRLEVVSAPAEVALS